MITSNIIHLFDGFVSLMTAVAIFPSIKYYYQAENLNSIEKATFGVHSWLFVFFIIRFLFQVFSLNFLSGFLYTAAIILAFNVAIYFEILLRHHYHRWFKVYLTLGSIFFSIVAMARMLSGHLHMLVAFGLFIISTQLIILAYCFFRDIKKYSNLENKQISLSAFSLLMLAPFFLTDVSTYGLQGVPQLGPVAALLLVYISINDQIILKGRSYIYLNILKSIVSSIIITFGVNIFLQSDDSAVLGRICILIFGLNISYRIFYALKNKRLDSDIGHFVKLLFGQNIYSIEHLLVFLKKIFSGINSMSIRSDKITQFDTTKIFNYMHKRKSVIIDLYNLREDIQTLELEEKNICMQIIDLLESNGMTHLMILGKLKIIFILFELPINQYSEILETQANILNHYVLGLEKIESTIILNTQSN